MQLLIDRKRFMTLARIFLILSGLVLTIYGFYCLFNPWALQELTSMVLTNATAITEVRAMYGGLEVTIGLYLIICGSKQSMIMQGLLLVAFCFVGLSSARAFGICIDNDSSTYNLSALIYEFSSALIASFLLIFYSKKNRSNII